MLSESICRAMHSIFFVTIFSSSLVEIVTHLYQLEKKSSDKSKVEPLFSLQSLRKRGGNHKQLLSTHASKIEHTELLSTKIEQINDHW